VIHVQTTPLEAVKVAPKFFLENHTFEQVAISLQPVITWLFWQIRQNDR